MATAPRLLLVRHGETNENVQETDQGIVQGQLDTPLNEVGRRQAIMTGNALKDVPLARIVSSPLARAKDTANEIARHHPEISVETDARIMERNFGVLQGQKYRGPSQKPEDTQGIESSVAMTARLDSFFQDIRPSAAQSEGVTVIVSHGGALSCLMNNVMLPSGQVVLEPHVTPSRFWNCSITEISLGQSPAILSRWADTMHLTESSEVINVDESL
ncbi:phosphoglycerate mutase (2,3-diphosphoglycerate-independent) [Malassezia yamatoensis]|uniref:Phosphoglycerate mutase (2,3-diphosphoglycerate-independent) n=1 Tax=Malassezia yamatoensis TaxID=253288 RepID=A0AAJ5YR60_9BASI|nr:phosphoglycerate mutase (2,3-diphosphoglycerate-independent) [Malassezia yamatoensis]